MAKKCIDADLLRKAVEKQIDYAKGVYPKGSIEEARASAITAVYRNILASIDSLQQEQPDAEALKREWWNKGYYEGRKNAHIPAKELGLPKAWDFQQEQPCEDLEEAATEIVIKMHPSLKDCTILGDRLTRGQLMALVKAGSEWRYQKDRREFAKLKAKEWSDGYNEGFAKGREQMPMPEDTVIFQKGIEEGKRLMMEDAVEGTYDTADWGVPCIGLNMPLDLERFDKVKIVIVKED